MTVGDKIRALCEDRQISAYQLSKAIGIDHSAGYKLFMRKTIKTATLSRIADFFGVDVSDLLSDTEESEDKSDVGSVHVLNSFNNNQTNVKKHNYTRSETDKAFNDLRFLQKEVRRLEKENEKLKNEVTICNNTIVYNRSIIEELNNNISNKEEVIRTKDQLINLLMNKKEE